ncbi:hypothetical protein BDY21DRAFT_293144 [Lineolata rhizophorae]|uniref:Ubiquitin carboxyl-terminal hydrolase n=1 Tax=Lineolata rhizophorae TaxID=578093 RepID=A0A6A6NNN4_9PEZI|nr:hypothetical protein BDY21DRAFT_293144 [Lineolata rhizophorae]
MPDRPLTIAGYAAGASLAAITLVYVFGPTFFLDDEYAHAAAAAGRKKGVVVGLSNPANDCFINSVLQALAGLSDLRFYLIREVHRRKLDGPETYRVDADEPPLRRSNGKEVPPWKIEGLRQGIVTVALKDMLDRLNERPLYKKIISAQPFVSVLERAFRQRISRQQQDAQEFLQVVTERLCDEYHEGRKARERIRRLRRAGYSLDLPSIDVGEDGGSEVMPMPPLPQSGGGQDGEPQRDDGEGEEEEEGFPFEGKTESQIECTLCHFTPKALSETFTTLPLTVPQKSSTSLNECFDVMLKTEYIDDFKCEKCRLVHAVEVKERELRLARSETQKEKLDVEISKIYDAIETDPEKPPKDVELPDIKLAPKRRIARHHRISVFPKILAVHLSRSIYSTYSTKNMAKVSFPEALPLGGLLDQKKYRLLGVVTHKGGHNSGHYESFRRQVPLAPFSTPHSFGNQGVYSTSVSPNPSTQPQQQQQQQHPPPLPSDLAARVTVPRGIMPSSPASSASSVSSRSSARQQRLGPAPTSAPRDDASAPAAANGASSSSSSSARVSLAPPAGPRPGSRASARAPSVVDVARLKKKAAAAARKAGNRWWRISDEKVQQSKTSEVLGMQKEVYLLFYELDKRAMGEDE